MIDIRVRLDSLGCLREFQASGHAGAARAGEDIVCAAATVLLRTCAQLASSALGGAADARAPEPGRMRLLLGSVPPERVEWLHGITDFLLAGITGLQKEYPDRLTVKINGNSENTGVEDGA